MSESHYQPRLTIYVVWHPDYEQGNKFANHLYSWLTRDVKNPMSRRIGIPLFFRNMSDAKSGASSAIPFDDSQHTVVVALVDDCLVASDAWDEYLGSLWKKTQFPHSPHRLFPVSISPNAFNLYSGVPEANFIRLHDLEEGRQPAALARSLTHELCRLLLAQERAGISSATGVSFAPVKLFLSHAKRDGLDIAEHFRDYLHRKTALKSFFDANDIAPSYSFADEIKAQIQDAAVLAIQTDAYASREWCRREILMAKQMQRPLVVVNAVRKNEERSFPYLANVATMRWKMDQIQDDQESYNQAIESVLDLMLYEVLKDVYLRQHFEDVCQLFDLPIEADKFTRPPELLTLLHLQKTIKCEKKNIKMLIYPDPPLGAEEIEVLSILSPDLTFTTPYLLGGNTMETTQQHSSLENYCIGLSISESPDLPALGLGDIHLQDAMVEFARYLLASGASLAYGGDLRAGGFTETLFKLVEANNKQGLPPYKRIINFLAWPLHLKLTMQQKAQLKGVADFRPLEPPADLNVDPITFLPPNSAEDSYIWARCLTVMREKMSLETDARLLLGGRLTGYKGKYPGLIEEAYVCLHDEKPLFLLGGFGGCAKAVIDVIHGAHPESLTTAYQIAQNPGYEEFMTYYNAQVKQHPESGQEPIDYDALVAFFQEKGVTGLNNGLSPEENERLFVTPHIPEMISLVLKGLSRLSTNM